VTVGHSAMYRSNVGPSVVRSALAIDALDAARAFVDRSETITMRDQIFIETSSALVVEAEGTADAATWAELEERWRAYGNRYEQGLAARALGRVSGDEAATSRGVELLADLGVPT
jgi:hypothetical protein